MRKSGSKSYIARYTFERNDSRSNVLTEMEGASFIRANSAKHVITYDDNSLSLKRYNSERNAYNPSSSCDNDCNRSRRNTHGDEEEYTVFVSTKHNSATTNRKRILKTKTTNNNYGAGSRVSDKKKVVEMCNGKSNNNSNNNDQVSNVHRKSDTSETDVDCSGCGAEVLGITKVDFHRTQKVTESNTNTQSRRKSKSQRSGKEVQVPSISTGRKSRIIQKSNVKIIDNSNIAFVQDQVYYLFKKTFRKNYGRHHTEFKSKNYWKKQLNHVINTNINNQYAWLSNDKFEDFYGCTIEEFKSVLETAKFKIIKPESYRDLLFE